VKPIGAELIIVLAGVLVRRMTPTIRNVVPTLTE
jgi:hypothetical protein